MSLRVVMIEDNVLALEAMSAELSKYPDIEVVATATGAMGEDNLLQLMRENQPDVVIFDLSAEVPGLGPVTAVMALKRAFPMVEILTLIDRGDGMLVRGLIDAGTRGCLFDSDEETTPLGTRVCQVSEGKMGYSTKVMEKYIELSNFILTPRELDVLHMVAKGKSNGAIAERLAIANSTVRNYLSKIYEKLGVPRDSEVNRRVCAINIARQWGLL